MTLIGYVIASAIPVFSTLCSLVGALFGCLVSMVPMGMMWLKDNWVGNPNRTLKHKLGAAWAIFVVVAGIFVTVGGTYGAVVAMVNAGENGKPWGCEDNSGTSSAS